MNVQSDSTNHTHNGGLTIIEILITLLVLSVGLVLITATMPISIKSSTATDEMANAQIIASNYIAVLKAGAVVIPTTTFAQNVSAVFPPSGSVPPDANPTLFVMDSPADVYDTPDYTKYFRDLTVSSGNYFVNISYCSSGNNPPARLYRIAVRREGGEWIMYHFFRCDY